MSLGKTSLLITAASLVGAATSYIFNPILIAPTLGPQGIARLGAYHYLYYALSFPQRPVSLTLIHYLSQYRAQDKPQQAEALVSQGFRLLAIYGLLTCLLLAMVSRPIALYLNLDSKDPVLAAIALAYVGLLFTALLADLQGLFRFPEYAAALLADPAVRLAAGTLFMSLGFAVRGAMAAYIVGYMVASIIAAWFLRHFFSRRGQELIDVRGMAAYSLPAFLYSAYLGFLTSADVLFAKHYFMDSAAGIYVAVASLVKVAFVVVLPLASVSFAYMSDAVSRTKSAVKILRRTLWLTSLGCLAMLGICFVFPSVLIRLTYGPQFTDAVALLPYAALAQIPGILTVIYCHYCLARRDSRFVRGLAWGVALHVGLLLLYHDTLRELIFTWGAGCLLQLVLVLVTDLWPSPSKRKVA